MLFQTPAVGHNGAGKTNLFFGKLFCLNATFRKFCFFFTDLCNHTFICYVAIQFVLSHEYQSLPERQRIDLLHASSAMRATSAYVEIVFNNEDRHLPVCIITMGLPKCF